MSLMNGKKGLIMGVANERSIAWGISQKLSEAGAELAFTYLGDALKKRVIPLAEKLNSNVTFSCDVEKKEDIIKLFEDVKSSWGEIDFVVHAIAFSDKSELSDFFDGPTAIAYSNDPVQLTKLLSNFAKNNSDLVILGGIMDNEILTVEKIEILSKLPSLEEIRAQLIGLISTPAQKIASVLTAPSGDLARVFNAYSTK